MNRSFLHKKKKNMKKSTILYLNFLTVEPLTHPWKGPEKDARPQVENHCIVILATFIFIFLGNIFVTPKRLIM